MKAYAIMCGNCIWSHVEFSLAGTIGAYTQHIKSSHWTINIHLPVLNAWYPNKEYHTMIDDWSGLGYYNSPTRNPVQGELGKSIAHKAPTLIAMERHPNKRALDQADLDTWWVIVAKKGAYA